MSTKKSSSIWEHFTINLANCTVAVCNVCDIKLSGGYLIRYIPTFYPCSICYGPVFVRRSIRYSRCCIKKAIHIITQTIKPHLTDNISLASDTGCCDWHLTGCIVYSSFGGRSFDVAGQHGTMCHCPCKKTLAANSLSDFYEQFYLGLTFNHGALGLLLCLCHPTIYAKVLYKQIKSKFNWHHAQ